MYLFTADLHFGEEEIIEREARPFKDMKEMEDAFVANVNSMAGEEDFLYVLGDWINYNRIHHSDISAFESVRRLIPRVILLTGNNEERFVENIYGGDMESFRGDLIKMGFEDVVDEADVTFGGESFHLIHRPEDHRKGCLNLFGHTHRATGLWKPFGLNVGIDLNYFRPFSEKEILRILRMKREWMDDDPSVLSL